MTSISLDGKHKMFFTHFLYLWISHTKHYTTHCSVKTFQNQILFRVVRPSAKMLYVSYNVIFFFLLSHQFSILIAETSMRSCPTCQLSRVTWELSRVTKAFNIKIYLRNFPCNLCVLQAQKYNKLPINNKKILSHCYSCNYGSVYSMWQSVGCAFSNIELRNKKK